MFLAILESILQSFYRIFTSLKSIVKYVLAETVHIANLFFFGFFVIIQGNLISERDILTQFGFDKTALSRITN